MKIYFHIKSTFRERQWDTVRHLPPDLEAILPDNTAPIGSPQKHLLVEHELQHRSLKRRILKTFPLLNLRLVPKKAEKADLLYHWGSFPVFSSKPFVVEFDNPYCVSFYDRKSSQLYRPLILHYLKKAQKLVCMSEACKKHLLEVYGETFDDKTLVQYPFMGSQKFVPLERRGPLQLLFIGLQFRLKGGPELLQAFEGLPDQNVRLTVISFVPPEIKARYAKDSRIKFINPVSRQELINQYFPISDILGLPTLYESFGMVVLEALSFGLGIISTDIYAMKEMVRDNINGRLLTHPIEADLKSGESSLQEYQRTHLSGTPLFSGFGENMRDAISLAGEQVSSWKSASRSIFQEKFSEKIWKTRFKSLVREY